MQPDRIYGLRTTEAMEKILQQSHISQLGEDPELEDVLLNRLTISCNPDSGGRASIYPFLVMEAKSLKGGSNFQKSRHKRQYRSETICTCSSSFKKTSSTGFKCQEVH
jgi:hypothetical protein